MIRFTQPDIVPLPGYWVPRYRVRRAYRAQWVDLEGDVRTVVVPEGYEMDGSTEWIVKLILPFLPAIFIFALGLRADGPHRGAAVVHDWLGHKRPFGRAEIDWAFLQLALDGGVPWWAAWMRWGVVRMFGWIPWVLRAR